MRLSVLFAASAVLSISNAFTIKGRILQGRDNTLAVKKVAGVAGYLEAAREGVAFKRQASTCDTTCVIYQSMAAPTASACASEFCSSLIQSTITVYTSETHLALATVDEYTTIGVDGNGNVIPATPTALPPSFSVVHRDLLATPTCISNYEPSYITSACSCLVTPTPTTVTYEYCFTTTATTTNVVTAYTTVILTTSSILTGVGPIHNITTSSTSASLLVYTVPAPLSTTSASKLSTSIPSSSSSSGAAHSSATIISSVTTASSSSSTSLEVSSSASPSSRSLSSTVASSSPAASSSTSTLSTTISSTPAITSSSSSMTIATTLTSSTSSSAIATTSAAPDCGVGIHGCIFGEYILTTIEIPTNSSSTCEADCVAFPTCIGFQYGYPSSNQEYNCNLLNGTAAEAYDSAGTLGDLTYCDNFTIYDSPCSFV